MALSTQIAWLGCTNSNNELLDSQPPLLSSDHQIIRWQSDNQNSKINYLTVNHLYLFVFCFFVLTDNQQRIIRRSHWKFCLNLKSRWNFNEIPMEIHWNPSWNFNEIPIEKIHWKLRWNSIENFNEIPLEIQLKFQ